MSKCRFLLGLAGLLVAAVAPAEVLRFTYHAGDKYRIKTTVQEDVFLNERFQHRAEILNKIAVEVQEVRGEAGYLVATFQTSERRFGSEAPFSLTEDYDSEFWRDGRGIFEIAPRYFMPVVRDVPVFPEDTVEPGDTWVAQGSEVHDFRLSGLADPLYFPITVAYRYMGDELLEGRRLAVIGISYTVFHRREPLAGAGDFDPVRITGYSDQRLRFDIELGQPRSYEEDFEFIFTLSSGDSVAYRGRSWGELTETEGLNRQQVAEEIRKALEDQKVTDATVAVEEEGVTITLENIQFPPDSAYLMPSEKNKIQKIGQIISGYDRDILVTGHTARVGTEESCQILSEERAEAVGDYLLTLGAKNPDQLVYRGMGSREPVADNSTEEGRSRNRRVEITILEN